MYVTHIFKFFSTFQILKAHTWSVCKLLTCHPKNVSVPFIFAILLFDSHTKANYSKTDMSNSGPT